MAWLYFIGGLTQQEIASRLDLTRLRVNRIIGQVQAEGQVQIDVRLPLVDCVALAEGVAERYGLVDVVVVVPDLDDYIEQKRVIGEAAGAMTAGLIEGRDFGIGIASGRTLSFAVRTIPAKPHPRSWVVGLTGASRARRAPTRSRSPRASPAASASSATTSPRRSTARRPEPRGAPVERRLTDVLARTEIADFAMTSCGSLAQDTTLTHIRVVKDHLDDILRLGAVGELMGCFLDMEGRPIDHFLNEAVIALSPDKLKLKPYSVLVSGGTDKIQIIRAILRGGYVNRLVTNESVARALLAGPR